jgi:hypothetical protein
LSAMLLLLLTLPLSGSVVTDNVVGKWRCKIGCRGKIQLLFNFTQAWKISNATKLRIFRRPLFCVCAENGRLQNQKRLANTDINVPFRRILKILQPNFNPNEELWRHSQKKPVAVQLKWRKWIRLTLRKDPWNKLWVRIPKDNLEEDDQKRSWRRRTDEDVEIVGKTWKEYF